MNSTTVHKVRPSPLTLPCWRAHLDDQHVDDSGVRDVLVLHKHLPDFVLGLPGADVQLEQGHYRETETVTPDHLNQSPGVPTTRPPEPEPRGTYNQTT